MNIVQNWFGSRFTQLHPLLQQLHTHGGKLSGKVNVSYGNGVAGLFGKRIGHKLGIPNSGTHQLTVDIYHDDNVLHWNRTFNDEEKIISQFMPVGGIDHGYWLETTGDIQLCLSVNLIDGGWHWQCQQMKFKNIRLPLGLMPTTTAYKKIVDDHYYFYVGFTLPGNARMLEYHGQLQLIA